MLLIPFVTYLNLWAVLHALRPSWGWRLSAIRAGVIHGAYAVLATEGLSLFRWVSPEGFAIAWLVLLLGLVAVLVSRVRQGRAVRLPRVALRFGRVEVALMSGVILVSAVTAVVAWYAPPQTWDSLNYHMPRVAHWARQASIQHFATGIEVQNSRTPAAEFLVLHTYVLAGSDRAANFVQWSAMVLSLIGVSVLAAQLGAGTRGQLAASVFVATLPMGIIQASSTTTDYMVAIWVLAAMVEALRFEGTARAGPGLVFLGLSAGLALSTKPTAVAYLAPVGAYLVLLLIRHMRGFAFVKWMATVAALIVLLNLGHLIRNARTYGGIVNPAQVRIHNNELRSLAGITSNLVRQAGLHAGTPSPHVNKALTLGIQWIHQLIKLDMNDPRTTGHGLFRVTPPTTNEDRAGNQLHAYLLVCMAIASALRARSIARNEWILAAWLGLAFLTICFLFKWQIFASRYHLPFFVIAGALAGRTLERVGRSSWLPVISALMILGAWPWLVQIKSRPLIPKPGDSYVDSILREPREILYLANGRNLIDPYGSFTRQLTVAGCEEVGIALGGNAAEYPIWAYLGAPGSGVAIEWIVSGTPSAQYRDGDYQPCGIICENCPPEWGEFRGLPLVERKAEFQLYQGLR